MFKRFRERDAANGIPATSDPGTKLDAADKGVCALERYGLRWRQRFQSLNMSGYPLDDLNSLLNGFSHHHALLVGGPKISTGFKPAAIEVLGGLISAIIPLLARPAEMKWSSLFGAIQLLG